MSLSERRWNANPHLDSIAKNAAIRADDALREHGSNSKVYQREQTREREITRKINAYLLGETDVCPY